MLTVTTGWLEQGPSCVEMNNCQSLSDVMLDAKLTPYTSSGYILIVAIPGQGLILSKRRLRRTSELRFVKN